MKKLCGALIVASTLNGNAKAESNVSLGANAFAGYHETQGALIGGGVSLKGSDEKHAVGASMEIVSLSLESPKPYSYKAFLGFPIGDLNGNVFCSKDGMIDTLGCGLAVSLKKEWFVLGSGWEYRPQQIIAMNSSVGAAFKKFKVKLLAYIVTNSNGLVGGGTDVGTEVWPIENFGLYGRYNLFTNVDLADRHAAIGGIKTRW